MNISEEKMMKKRQSAKDTVDPIDARVYATWDRLTKLKVLHHTDAILRKHGMLWADNLDGTGRFVDGVTYRPASQKRVEAFKRERESQLGRGSASLFN